MQDKKRGIAPNFKVSIVLPAFNEAAIIATIVNRLRANYPEAEIIVVDDKSSDGTAEKAEEAGARVVRHLYNMGNGAAIRAVHRSAISGLRG